MWCKLSTLLITLFSSFIYNKSYDMHLPLWKNSYNAPQSLWDKFSNSLITFKLDVLTTLHNFCRNVMM